MNKAIKYRLYPTKLQSEYFRKTFGCCRKLWNLMLADKIDHYNLTGESLYVKPSQYKKDYPYLCEVDSLALANVWTNLNSAYSSFFSKSRKKRNGFPKFKSAKHSRKSYTTNNQHGTVVVLDNLIRLPKIGKVKAKIHRKPDADWLIKSVTVSMDPDDKFYASVLYEYDKSVITSVTADNAIGLDYSSENLYVDSNGSIGTNHKYYKESQKKLAKYQQRLSRMKGSRKNEVKSRNYIKQLRKVNKIHRHIANQRLDNLHKISTEIANQYDIVCAEDLNMKSLANKGFGNGKATLDNGYGMFLSMLEYKLADIGKYFIKVDKWYPSSQLCHCCGYRNTLVKNLRLRKWICPECNTKHDRDINAAINILNEGLRIFDLLPNMA